MRGKGLLEWEWVAHIEYSDYADSLLHFSSLDATDILSAIAHVYRHCRESGVFEVISLTQLPITADTRK